MSVRELRLISDPVLRTRAETVTSFDSRLLALVQDLLDTVQLPGRAGLAANQIGVNLAAFSYNVDGELGYLINPRIEHVEGDYDGPEGCLSVPGVRVLRARSSLVRLSGVDCEGTPRTIEGTGELARCFQHETDHLAGELFIDALSGERRQLAMQQLRLRMPDAVSARPPRRPATSAGIFGRS